MKQNLPGDLADHIESLGGWDKCFRCGRENGGSVERWIRRFQQEAKTIAHLQHIKILPVFDYGQDQGHTDTAMPFVGTGTLVDL